MSHAIKYSIRSLIVATALAAVAVFSYQYLNREFHIVEVPRPNSGTFSTEEAKSLLDSFLEKSTGVGRDSGLVVDWRSPAFGFHIHVDKDSTITIEKNVLPVRNPAVVKKSAGFQAVVFERDLMLSLLEGQPGNVLLTSDTNGWDSPEKRAIVELLFEPAIQLCVVQIKAD
ncbi:MAG: hypothetical protein AB8B55_22325 [Mariniblastus sp.]